MLDFKLEPCNEKDVDLIYEMANDYETRRNSFNSDFIKYSEHCNWFNESLNNHNRNIYLLKKEGLVIGQIRLDIEENRALISYSIKKEFRGNGYANKILYLIQVEIKKRKEITMLEGLVKKDNIASRKAFLKNEFKEYEEENLYRYVLYLS